MSDREMDKSEATQKAKPLVCSYCKDVSLYCKCAVENPLCETCLFVLTECVCPGATRKPRDFWEGATFYGPIWKDSKTKELLELYLTHFTVSMLAQHFQLTPPTVVRQLSKVIFGDASLGEDESKTRFQRTWSRAEIMFLAAQLQLGRTPTEISALMGRDPLGVAFALFQKLVVPVPREVITRYGVSVRREPFGDKLDRADR
jgi:hypothetical protein